MREENPIAESVPFDANVILSEGGDLHCVGEKKTSLAQRYGNANHFSILSTLTADQLNEVMLDEKASVSRRACARMLFDSLLHDNSAVRFRALREAMDRTEGKAVAREISVQLNLDLKGPDELLDDVRRLANFGMPE